MRTLPHVLALALALFSPLPGFAQAGSGGKGGDAVVCFDRNVKGARGQADYVTDGKITEEGRKHATLAYSREHWQITKFGDPSPFLKDLETRGATYAEALEEIIKRFDAYPIFSEKLREIDADVRAFHRGPRLTSVEDIKDSTISFEVPPNCAIIQAVVRELDLFRTNETATEQLVKFGARAAMMQAHELVYYYATQLKAHKDSGMTELLLLSVTGSDLTTEELGRQIARYSFSGAKAQDAGRDIFVTRDKLVELAEKEVARFEARLDTLSARLRRYDAYPCPDREDLGRGTISDTRYAFLNPALFWNRNVLIWEENVLPKTYFDSVEAIRNEAAAVARQVVSSVQRHVNDSGCLYLGTAVTQDQKNRIRAKLSDFIRLVRSR